MDTPRGPSTLRARGRSKFSTLARVTLERFTATPPLAASKSRGGKEKKLLSGHPVHGQRIVGVYSFRCSFKKDGYDVEGERVGVGAIQRAPGGVGGGGG